MSGILSNDHRVPVSKSGLHGWTLCCKGAVKFMYGAGSEELCCKGCYARVDEFHLPGLDLVMKAFFEVGYADRERTNAIEVAIEAQGRLLELARKNEARRVVV
jgi:hypothetical protein